MIFGSDPKLFHTLGIFFATFAYSLAALAWTDRGGSGWVPPFSTLLVGALLVVSMLAFARLIQSINNLQINNVLRTTGNKGRAVINELFRDFLKDDSSSVDDAGIIPQLGSQTQVLTYTGEPRVIARLDVDALVRLAQSGDALMVLECAVGDTLVEDTVLLRVHGSTLRLPEAALMRAIRLSNTRTFEQDPKYAVRMLVDIAIKALSPAVNDPTTAVQALDQIEDLLRRLGRRKLDAGRVIDSSGRIRLILQMPTWDDFSPILRRDPAVWGNFRASHATLAISLDRP